MSLRDLDKVMPDGSDHLRDIIVIALGEAKRPLTMLDIVGAIDLSFLPCNPNRYGLSNPYSGYALVLETLDGMMAEGLADRRLTGGGETYELRYGFMERRFA